MATARDLITDSLLDLGVLADEEAPTASQAAGALRKLNGIIASLNIEGLMVYGSTPQTLPLVNGQSVYTIGPSGNLNISRPNYILSAYIRNPSVPVEQRMDMPLYMYNQEEYADVTFKSSQSTLPRGIFFDYTYPLINAYIYPVPQNNNYSLVLWVPGQISDLTLNSDVLLAPGYYRLLQLLLTIELSPSYEVQPSEVTIQLAMQAKEGIKINNFSLDTLEIDPRLTTGYWFNIITGRYE